MNTIEKAYREGYVDGYRDGINADESCVPETTIFKNDFAKAWEKSETKTAIAKAEESSCWECRYFYSQKDRSGYAPPPDLCYLESRPVAKIRKIACRHFEKKVED